MHEIDWRYAVALDPPDRGLEPPGLGERVELVFDGIDTIATIRLGDGAERLELGRTYNMHRDGNGKLDRGLTGASRGSRQLR
jgi:beta-mannosidase